MIKLEDNEKEILRELGKKYLKNNDILGFCRAQDSAGAINPGRIMQFLMENGIPVFDYLEFIPDKMFLGAEIESISIPNHITRIGKSAFRNCSDLTSVNIGDSVIQIGDHAFGNCGKLTEVFLPNSVRVLGSDVFEDCSNNLIIYAEKRGPGNRLKCKQGEIPWYKEHLFRQPETTEEDAEQEEQL